MSDNAKSYSTGLFVQAGLTGLLAPTRAHGSTWVMATFAVAAGAVVVGALARGGHDRTRELVLAFEAVAIAVGIVGVVSGHYIPGTIFGVRALFAALSDRAPQAAVVGSTPAGAIPAPLLPSQLPATVPTPMPVLAPAPAAAPAAAPAPTPAAALPQSPPTARAINILPGG